MTYLAKPHGSGWVLLYWHQETGDWRFMHRKCRFDTFDEILDFVFSRDGTLIYPT